MWFNSKFIDGSKEVLNGISGEAEGFASMFDSVEKGDIFTIKEEVKVPLAQAENTPKARDTIPSVGLWQGFPNDEKISLLDLGQDQVSCCFASWSSCPIERPCCWVGAGLH